MMPKLEPFAGPARPIAVSLDEADLRQIDEWRRDQPGIPARGTAIRHFIRRGLAAAKQEEPQHA
jgi:hypothetical protein